MSSMTDLMNLPFPHPRELPTGDDVRHSKVIIKQLDQNIEDLEQNIGRLQEQIREIQRKKANYISYISPLTRLPIGVLSEIISICLESGVDVTIMSAICGRLREAVLGMAGLWTHILLRPLDHTFFPPFYGWSIHVSCWIG
jgi:hypothetical protein